MINWLEVLCTNNSRCGDVHVQRRNRQESSSNFILINAKFWGIKYCEVCLTLSEKWLRRKTYNWKINKLHITLVAFYQVFSYLISEILHFKIFCISCTHLCQRNNFSSCCDNRSANKTISVASQVHHFVNHQNVNTINRKARSICGWSEYLHNCYIINN